MLLVLLLLAGCSVPQVTATTPASVSATSTSAAPTSGSASRSPTAPSASAASTGGNASHSPAASSASAGREEAHPIFDGEKAFALLKKQCDFGVRPLGTEAHEKTRDYLIAQMRLVADEVILQEFTYRGMKVTNIVGVIYPEGTKAPAKAPVLLTAHWDTRPISDGPASPEIKDGFVYRYGPKGWNRLTPTPGADDGASGVAVLP